ncbi:hypothetical protein GUITHDRAFT_155846 [Guillardia theta CCMP2712]|uniref:Uncharacterized protein n=1 Tax=Guillardia theta (strain CCMP2712) TaxID=905079 RepID=L1ICT3_GUITC|nr:hypothetical protein GUITHDRAFT_155846 [Guillardia theta CCMP2712]EKX34061.1 hypothetical protein GUITHDRAFT_155846 [Guillardia theta CCMP2712]|eukprot:XP_005821041.1 hypothetical protein GUITHDRAFT_155846 [Guillardia theta CCMP2712]
MPQNEEDEKGSGYIPTIKDITLFGRRGADIACKAVIEKLKACRERNPTNPSACAEDADNVMECRGSFLCPAVAAAWVKCMEAKANGFVSECDRQREALSHCMDCNSTE